MAICFCCCCFAILLLLFFLNHYVVFFLSNCLSLRLGVQMGTGEFTAGGSPVMD